MFRSLLWKEWKENLWKLCFCALVSVSFTALLFRIRITPDLANCVAVSMVQMFVIPIIYGLDIFSGEASNRTIQLLFKIPVPRRAIFFSKYLISIMGIALTFIITGALMEYMTAGREVTILMLLRINWLCGLVALVLFTWFCAFGCQSTSEAASLAIMFAVYIGWAIIFFWARICEVTWAQYLVPYSVIHIDGKVLAGTIIAQIPGVVLVLCIACKRYADIRRSL